MDKLEYENWRQKYFNKRLVDFTKYLDQKDLEILEKLEIKIENKIYTEYEFDIVEQDLMKYYEEEEQRQNTDSEYTKPLINGVTREQYNCILEKFAEISKDCKC